MIYPAEGLGRARRGEVRSDAEAAVPPPVDANEERLVDALLAGDEAAFDALFDELESTMLRVAMAYVGSFASAEDVVQETWLAVIRGLPAFRREASLRTWIFRILMNRARARGRREARMIPLSNLARVDGTSASVSETVDRLAARAGAISPQREHAPLRDVLNAELRGRIEAAVARLPGRQRVVLTMRDIEGWTAREVCNALGISETNQRVLLHRARTAVRRAIGAYLEDGSMSGDGHPRMR